MANKFGADPAGVPTGASVADNVLSNFQGMFSVTPHGKYITGSRTIIRINGKLAAFAFSVSWNINTEQDEIFTIDDWTAYEIAPKKISINGTIGGFHIPGKSPTVTLIMPNLFSFMFHKYITIEVRDRSTDALLFQTNKAVITSYSEENRAGQIGGITLNWKAIGWADEMIPQLPGGLEEGANGSAGGLNEVAGFLGATPFTT